MKRFRNIAVAMLAFGLIAAACGGDDAESTTTVAPATTMAEEMTEAALPGGTNRNGGDKGLLTEADAGRDHLL